MRRRHRSGHVERLSPLLAIFACGPAAPPPEVPRDERVRPNEECDAEPDRGKVSASLDAVAAAVRACDPSRTKTVRIGVSFRGDGTVASAEVIGPSGEPRRYPSRGTVMNLATDVPEHDGTIAGTPAAACMQEAVLSASTHSFCDVMLLAIYPFPP